MLSNLHGSSVCWADEMQDLLFGTIVVFGAATLAFFAGREVRANRRLLFVGTILVTFCFAMFWQGNLGWISVFPHSASLLLSNLTPILMAFIAGFACRGLKLKCLPRPVLVFAITLVAIACLVAPMIRPCLAPAQISKGGKLKDGFVMQSHESTCAPASAANLLRMNGIASSEAQMAGPCLTSSLGTEALGLYRGLKLGCRETYFDVRLASRNPLLWKSLQQLPNAALVQFSDDEFSQKVTPDELRHPGESSKGQSAMLGGATNSRTWCYLGDQNAAGHVVVVKDYVDGYWLVIDPAVGLVKWSHREMATRFTGEALYLEDQQH